MLPPASTRSRRPPLRRHVRARRGNARCRRNTRLRRARLGVDGHGRYGSIRGAFRRSRRHVERRARAAAHVPPGLRPADPRVGSAVIRSISTRGGGLLALVLALLAAGCGGSRGPEWQHPNADLGSRRSLPSSGIDSERLRAARRLAIPDPDAGRSVRGVHSDSRRERRDGLPPGHEEQRLCPQPGDGQGGVAAPLRRYEPGPERPRDRAGRVYGATDSSAFALDAATGRTIWRHFLMTPTAPYVDIAPQVAGRHCLPEHDRVVPNGNGVLIALDGGTGKLRWTLATVKEGWKVPARAGGAVRGTRRASQGERSTGGPRTRSRGAAADACRTAPPMPATRSTPTRCSQSTRAQGDRLVRPGHATRRAGLRLRGAADPRRPPAVAAWSSGPGRRGS